MAVYSEILIEQGCTFSIKIFAVGVSGEAVNLEDWTARAALKKSPFSTTFVEFSAEIVDFSNGEIELQLSAEQTRSLKPGRYVWDAVISFEDQVIRVAEGQAEVTPQVTPPQEDP